MKKTLSVIIALVMMLSLASVAFAADGTTVYVTITDKNKNFVVANEAVAVTDIDEDQAITINDALYCAHEKFYSGGAKAGYASSMTTYGLSLDMLWGYKSPDNFGYYNNNASAWNLGDNLKDGDCVYAFVYTDTQNWSDTYSFFGSTSTEAIAYGTVDVVLNCLEFDMETFTNVEKPVEGATILVNGKDSGVVTDKDGKATVTVASFGDSIISAEKDGVNLVPPICVADVSFEFASITNMISYFINLIFGSITGLFSK